MSLDLKSIASKLVIGGLFVVITPLMVINVLSYNQTKKSISQISYQNAENTASDLAELTNHILLSLKARAELLSVQKNVTDLADSVEKNGEENSATHIAHVFSSLGQQFKSIGKNYQGIFIADTHGKLITGILENGKEYKGSNISDRSYFKKAMSTGKTVLSQIVISKKTGRPIVVACAPVKNEDNVIVGALATVIKADIIAEKISGRMIGKTGYCFMVDKNGIMLAHPEKEYVLDLDISDIDGMGALFQTMSRQEQGAIDYVFNGVEKIGGVAPVGINGWSVCATQNKKEFLAASVKLRNTNFVILLVSLVISVSLVLFSAKSIVKPINSVVLGLKEIATGDGDLTRRLDINTGDEAEKLAKWFNIFMDNLQEMIAGIKTNVDSLTRASESLSIISDEMSSISADSAEKTKRVTDSVSTMNSDIQNAVSEMDKSSANSHMIATASEQITSTIEGIAKNSGSADEITTRALNEVEFSSQKIKSLSGEVQDIDQVTNLITDIAQQVNLLALNATIEAARAGEAGKGFAVVANEIKELSNETSDAAKSIKFKIESIQSTSSFLVENISATFSTIKASNDAVSDIAAAVEEQSLTISEISSNIVESASSLKSINSELTKSSMNLSDIDQELKLLDNDAEKIMGTGDTVKKSSMELEIISKDLQERVGRFIM